MRIRLRGPNGVSTLNLENDATVGELRAQIKEKTLLIKYDIKFDYPPKPLQLGQDSTLLSELDVQLDGKQLIVSSQDALVVEKPAGCNVSATQSATSIGAATPSKPGSQSQPSSAFSFAGMPSADINSFTEPSKDKSHQIPLKRKTMEGEVPEIPLPDRGATLGMFNISRNDFKLLLMFQ
jgi:ubiquitin thioesterase OTU1